MTDEASEAPARRAPRRTSSSKNMLRFSTRSISFSSIRSFRRRDVASSLPPTPCACCACTVTISTTMMVTMRER